MSITDELREFIKTHLYLGATALGGWKEEAYAIADRIDAEHGASIIASGVKIVNDYVKLPTDADGEPIHIGDVMDSKVDYLFDGRPFEVRAMRRDECGWEVYDRLGDRYEPNSLRHHEPTVEDVLREMCLEIDRRCESGGIDYNELFAEYAKRIREVVE